MDTNQDIKGFAVRYARYSRDEQGDGDSLRRQNGQFEEFCRKHELAPLPGVELPPDKGVSAFRSANARRGKLADFLVMVKDGRIPRGTTLVIENQDRLSRDKVSVAEELFKQLLRSGIRIGDCSSGEIYDDTSLEEPLTLISIIFGAVKANDYSELLRTRLKSAWSGKRELATVKTVTPEGEEIISKGVLMTAMRPSWLKPITRKVTIAGKERDEVLGYEEIPERVETVRLIFKWACEGKGGYAIADALEKKGIKSFRGRERWNANVVVRLIKNRTTLGEFQPRERVTRNKLANVGKPIPGYYPPIITQAAFDKANTQVTDRIVKRAGRPPNSDRINIFAGLLYDPDDRPYHIMVKYPNKKVRSNPYRVLQSKYGRGGPSISYEKMEEAFIESVKELDPNDFQARIDDDTQRLIEKLAAIDGKLARIQDRIKSESDIDYLLDTKRDLTKDREATRKALEASERARRNPTSESVRALQKATVDDKEYYRARLRLGIEKMTLKVREVKYAKLQWKVGDVAVYFRGGYTKTYTFIYRNSRGYLNEPLKLSGASRWENHDLGPWQDMLDDEYKVVFLSEVLEGAIIKGATNEELASLEPAAWSENHPEEQGE
jgi:hypothetical protein